jgi:hypothetical protein
MQTASKIGDDRVIKLLRLVSILVVRNAALEIPHGHMQPVACLRASFVSIGLIPTGIDKCNTKITIDTVRDPNLFQVEN